VVLRLSSVLVMVKQVELSMCLRRPPYSFLHNEFRYLAAASQQLAVELRGRLHLLVVTAEVDALGNVRLTLELELGNVVAMFKLHLEQKPRAAALTCREFP
jgi:hypothetical protein